jgi:hypothetical protein
VPSERVRKMEIRANEAFDVYRELYYEGGVSSVYFWNLDDGFAGVVLLKKGAPSFPLSSAVLAVSARCFVGMAFEPAPWAGNEGFGMLIVCSRPGIGQGSGDLELNSRL